MEEPIQEEKCITPGLEHKLEFVVAAYGYQCFSCIFCPYFEDVAEDSLP